MLNSHTPVAQNVADEVVFRRLHGEGVEFFFNRTSRFLMRIFWKKTILVLPAVIFQWVSYQDHVLSQMVLWLIRTNEIEEKKNDVYSH